MAPARVVLSTLPFVKWFIASLSDETGGGAEWDLEMPGAVLRSRLDLKHPAQGGKGIASDKLLARLPGAMRSISHGHRVSGDSGVAAHPFQEK